MRRVHVAIGTVFVCLALTACGGGGPSAKVQKPKNEQETIREVYEIFEHRAKVNGHNPIEYAPPQCQVMAPELAYDCIKNLKRNGRAAR
jgi:hypothetical protein